MPRKQRNSIRTKAFITIGGQREPLDTLEPQKRNEIAAALKAVWLNAIFAGSVVFQSKAEEKSAVQNRDEELVD